MDYAGRGEFSGENPGEFSGENRGEFSGENRGGEFSGENRGEFSGENRGEFSGENTREFSGENPGEVVVGVARGLERLGLERSEARRRSRLAFAAGARSAEDMLRLALAG